jgi:hypothetical protein
MAQQTQTETQLPSYAHLNELFLVRDEGGSAQQDGMSRACGHCNPSDSGYRPERVSKEDVD